MFINKKEIQRIVTYSLKPNLGRIVSISAKGPEKILEIGEQFVSSLEKDLTWGIHIKIYMKSFRIKNVITTIDARSSGVMVSKSCLWILGLV